MSVANLDTYAIARTEAAFSREIREAGLRLEAKIERMKSEIVSWMFVQTLLILGAFVVLGRLGH